MYQNKNPSNQKRTTYDVPLVLTSYNPQDNYYLDHEYLEQPDPYQPQPSYYMPMPPPQSLPFFYDKNNPQFQQAMTAVPPGFSQMFNFPSHFSLQPQATPNYLPIQQNTFPMDMDVMNHMYQTFKQQTQSQPPEPENKQIKKNRQKDKKLRVKVKTEEKIESPKEPDDLRKQLFDNTLTGYVLKIFEMHQQTPLAESYVVEQVRANMHRLKRPDGTKYKGNLYKTVKGSLTSNGIFKKIGGDSNEQQWIVNKEHAQEFEKRTVQRILHLADKRRILKRVRTQRSHPIEDDVIQGEENVIFPESQSHQNTFQQSITNKFSHVYNLLDGFILSQKENKHIRSTLESLETLQVNNMEDFQVMQKFVQGYDLKEVLEGIQECYQFFVQIFQDQKVEELQYE